jgi:hypothetical protein
MGMTYHDNAAVLILAAAKRSGLLRDLANALRQSRDIPGDEKCLACGVLDELTEEFGEECRDPGYDFFCEGFCVTQYPDAELTPYLDIPWELPPEQHPDSDYDNAIATVHAEKYRRARLHLVPTTN